MGFYLPSEVSRLVLSYMLDHDLQDTSAQFLEECPFLQELRQVAPEDLADYTRVNGRSLMEILREYKQMIKTISGEYKQVNPNNNFEAPQRMLDLLLEQRRAPVHVQKSAKKVVQPIRPKPPPALTPGIQISPHVRKPLRSSQPSSIKVSPGAPTTTFAGVPQITTTPVHNITINLPPVEPAAKSSIKKAQATSAAAESPTKNLVINTEENTLDDVPDHEDEEPVSSTSKPRSSTNSLWKTGSRKGKRPIRRGTHEKSKEQTDDEFLAELLGKPIAEMLGENVMMTKGQDQQKAISDVAANMLTPSLLDKLVDVVDLDQLPRPKDSASSPDSSKIGAETESRLSTPKLCKTTEGNTEDASKNVTTPGNLNATILSSLPQTPLPLSELDGTSTTLSCVPPVFVMSPPSIKPSVHQEQFKPNDLVRVQDESNVQHFELLQPIQNEEGREVWQVRNVLTDQITNYDNTEDRMFLLGNIQDLDIHSVVEQPQVEQILPEPVQHGPDLPPLPELLVPPPMPEHPLEITRLLEREDVACTWDFEDKCYVVIIPRSEYDDPEVQQAMKEELEKFRIYDAYEIIERPACEEDDNIVSTSWVITRKEKDGRSFVKARLCIRGDQELRLEDLAKDSPTISKINLRLTLVAAARDLKWDLESSDVQSAFLQTCPIERRVVVKPPKEAGLSKDLLWILNKAVYGLQDASRGFFIAYSAALIDCGMETLRTDPAMFLLFKDGTDRHSKSRTPLGVVSTHVDDSLTAGGAVFKEQVKKVMHERFTHGEADQLPFRFCGLNMKKGPDGSYTIDQQHYVSALTTPDMNDYADLNLDDLLGPKGQTAFRSAAAKLGMLAITSRPDLAFEAKIYATKYKKATKRDLKDVVKRIGYVRNDSTLQVYPNLGDLENWVILGFADAAHRNMPDKIHSCGGQVVMICNKVTDKACILGWRSKQLKRIVHSSFGAESLALIDLFADLRYLRSTLEQFYGTTVRSIPVIAFTDCKDLHENLYNIKNCTDLALIGTIAELKEQIHLENIVQEVRLVTTKQQLADTLSKATSSGQDLLRVLQTGRYVPPGGWCVKQTSGIFSRTWQQLQRRSYTDNHVLWAALKFAPDKSNK